MKRWQQTGLFIISLWLPPVIYGADDLLTIYQQAVESDPQWRAATASWQANKEALPQGRALLLPTAGLTANTSDNRTKFKSSNPIIGSSTQDFNAHGYALTITQPIFRATNIAQYRQSKLIVSRGDADLGAAEQELILRVTGAYFDVLKAGDALDTVNAELKAIARQLDQAQRRFEVGLIAITDVHEAKAAFDLATARVIEAENLLSVSKVALSELTGQTHNELKRLIDEIPLLKPTPDNEQAWVDTALTQNFEIQSAKYASEVAREEISRQRAGHYPTLDLVGNYSDNKSGGGRFGGSENTSRSISLQLAIPLFEGGAVNSRTREARSRFEEAKENYIGTRRATERVARSAYLSVLSDISRVHAFKQAVISAQSALEATEAGLEVGTRTIVDVLNVQQNLYRSRADFLKSRYDYILNTMRLKQAAGSLAPEDVKHINAWLE